MENIIFFDYGIEIIERGGDYFIRYDAGEIVSKLEEVKVSPEQVERAKRSEDDAYKVLLEATSGR